MSQTSEILAAEAALNARAKEILRAYPNVSAAYANDVGEIFWEVAEGYHLGNSVQRAGLGDRGNATEAEWLAGSELVDAAVAAAKTLRRRHGIAKGVRWEAAADILQARRASWRTKSCVRDGDTDGDAPLGEWEHGLLYGQGCSW